MSPTRTACATLVAIALTACGVRLPFVSAGSGGDYFKTRLCGVAIDNRSREARLKLELAVARTLPRQALVETEFQDHVEKTTMSVSRTVTGNERALEILSPPFANVRAGRYETVTRVYAAADKRQVIGVHAHTCESLIDQRELGVGLPSK